MPESGPAGVLHPSWHRVVLKLSGGLFAGAEPLGISPDVVAHLAAEIIAAVKDGVQVAARFGGGKQRLWGAARLNGYRPGLADMGMPSTVIDPPGLDVLENSGRDPGADGHHHGPGGRGRYIPRRAVRHLEKGAGS